MEAEAIGHDLARGRARFFRQKALPGAAAIEEAEAELGAEPSITLTPEEAPIGYGEGLPDNPAFLEPPVFAEPPAFAELAPAQLPPAELAPAELAPAELRPAEVPPAQLSPVGAAEPPPVEAEAGAAGRSTAELSAVPEPAAEGADDEITLEVERIEAAPPATTARRGRRASAKRAPIAA